MTTASYANVLNRRFGPREPTDQPVWRGSFDENDPRAQVSFPFQGRSKKDVFSFISWFILGARAFAKETKKYGSAHTITNNMIDVAETLLRRCTDYDSGRCTPSIETIMEKTGFSRPTTIALLAKLRQHLGIDWVRRTVRVDHPEARSGQRVAQTSNAYLIDFERMPSRLRMYLRQRLKGVFDFDRLPAFKGSPILPPYWQRKLGRLVSKQRSSWQRSPQDAPVDREAQLREWSALEARLAHASTPQEQAAILFPDDPERQCWHVAEITAIAKPSEVSSSGEFRNPSSMGVRGIRQKE